MARGARRGDWDCRSDQVNDDTSTGACTFTAYSTHVRAQRIAGTRPARSDAIEVGEVTVAVQTSWFPVCRHSTGLWC
jgi:hypothetical protein